MELNQRGSVFDPRGVGGWSADPLLLLSPLLLILAVGSLLFRFLLMLGIIARVVAIGAGQGPPSGTLASARPGALYATGAVGRDGGSVGTFAATYSATTDRSQEERARFAAGSDAGRPASASSIGRRRPRSRGARQRPRRRGQRRRPARLVASGPDAGAAGQRAGAGHRPVEARLRLLWFRPDFADEGIEGLSRRRWVPASGAGIALPGEPVSIGLWAGLSAPRQQTTMWLRTVDGRGVFRFMNWGRGFTGINTSRRRYSGNATASSSRFHCSASS